MKAVVAREDAYDHGAAYQLDLHVKYLTRLCLTWQGKLRNIPCAMSESWGPSEKNLQEAMTFEFQGSWDAIDGDEPHAHDEGDGVDLESDDSVDGQEDDDMLELVEALELSNMYQDNNQELEDDLDIERGRRTQLGNKVERVYRDESGSPRKRSRKDVN